MKKTWMFFLCVFLLFPVKSAFGWNFSLVDYAFTTDIIEIIDEDYQIEFLNVLSHNTAWAARIGYYKHREDTDNVYAEGDRHWEIGFRWRFFLMERAPNLFFLGIGFDNRPEDNMIAPTGEAGINICLKPITVGIIGFAGYEFHWKETYDNRWVKGIEVRAGICF